jgi:DNA-binding transcriptional ArsR family regulator
MPKTKPARRTAAPAKAAAAAAAPVTDDLDRVFAVVARYFGVLSEPTRLRIMHTICQEERSVTAIVAATGFTQTNVSRHLALMHSVGVVSRRREGNVVYYQITDPEFIEICRTVCVRIAGQIDDQKPLKEDLLQFAAQH